MNETIVNGIRDFNRYYTNRLELLNKNILDLPYSFSESRVIYAIKNEEMCTLKTINDTLSMDYGYLSRIVSKFVEKGICKKINDTGDKRLNHISLTEAGHELYRELTIRSNTLIGQMIEDLSDASQEDLLSHMRAIERLLDQERQAEVHIRHTLKAGDIGYLIKMHGEHYYEACGYDHTFEAYVCHTFEEFLETYSPKKDRMWLAEIDGRIVGSIAIISRGESRGQLRWFLLEKDCRGMGLGKRLLNTALDYAKDFGFETLFLETTQDQDKAIGMYVKKGFKKIRETPVELWGGHLIEETYEIKFK